MLNPGSHTTLTPRQAKRFYNHYHLALCLLSSHQQQQQRKGLADLEQRQRWLAEQVKSYAPAAAAGTQGSYESQALLVQMQKLGKQLHVVLQHLSRKDSAVPDPADLQLLHWCFLFSRYPAAMVLI